MSSHFVAVDGESFGQGNDHRYVLLAAADDEGSKYEFDKSGLSTVRCFEFLLGLPKGVKVGFGFNYDVNMILRDLDNASLIRLWKLGWVVFKGYRIEWIPNKIFVVKSRSRKVTIYDVFGFFQSSFVKALEAWGFGPQQEIETMKKQRGSFDAQMKQLVIDYCLEECRQLSALCHALDLALQEAKLSVSSWIGAGAIAASLLSREGIADHHVLDSHFPDSIQSPILCAYFGGHVELYQQGIFPEVWNYDVSSAYPSEAMKLPSLTNGKWKRVRKYNSDAPYALWLCKWNIPEQYHIMPFPYRYAGNIYYPRQGVGWYHSVELEAALNLYPNHIRILEGWVFSPSENASPFDFVPRVYDRRQELKRKGLAAEKVLKLGLNSLYGKLAQGKGYQGQSPKFQSFFWAGMITAGCRAKVLNLASKNPSALIMVATDGLFFKEPLEVDTNGGLGGLDLTQMSDMFTAQPGIYQATTDKGTFGKSRGFFTREIDFDDLRQGYLSHGPNYIGRFKSERFSGLGTVMVTGNKSKWRTWTTTDRKLSLYPGRKFITPGEPVGDIVRHHPADKVSDELSQEYVPKKGQGDMSDEEFNLSLAHIEGNEQPMKDF